MSFESFEPQIQVLTKYKLQKNRSVLRLADIGVILLSLFLLLLHVLQLHSQEPSKESCAETTGLNIYSQSTFDLSFQNKKLLQKYFSRCEYKQSQKAGQPRENILQKELQGTLLCLRAVKNFASTSAAKPSFVRTSQGVQVSPPAEKVPLNIPHTFSYTLKKDIQSGNVQPFYGVLLQLKPERSLQDGKQLFLQGNHWLASEIIMESRYTSQALADPYYLNWLPKSLLAARRLELILRYLQQYRLQPDILRESKNPRDSELYYLIGRYYFAIVDLRLARTMFVDYLYQFQGSNYIPNGYYWIARSLEREAQLEAARTVYLLVMSYYSEHYLNNLAKYKAGVISLYLLKQQAEGFLRSRSVTNWQL